jgi:hypothetical protein
MKLNLLIILAVFAAVLAPAAAQDAPPKPPVGIPADAKWFNGSWYRIYLEAGGWKAAKEKCERRRGRLAVIKDEPTQTFIRELGGELSLWLGASEEVKGLWKWVDGSEITFKAWDDGQPDPASPKRQALHLWKGAWGDAYMDDKLVGYICEWKSK